MPQLIERTENGIPASLQSGRIQTTRIGPPPPAAARPQDHPRFPELLAAIRANQPTTDLQQEIGFPNKDVLLLRQVWGDFERLKATEARLEHEIANPTGHTAEEVRQAEGAIRAIERGILERNLAADTIRGEIATATRAVGEYERQMIEYRAAHPALLGNESDPEGGIQPADITEPAETHELFPAYTRALKRGEALNELALEIGISNQQAQGYAAVWQTWQAMVAHRDELRATASKASDKARPRIEKLLHEGESLEKQLMDERLHHQWVWDSGQALLGKLGAARAELKDLKSHWPQLLAE